MENQYEQLVEKLTTDTIQGKIEWKEDEKKIDELSSHYSYIAKIDYDLFVIYNSYVSEYYTDDYIRLKSSEFTKTISSEQVSEEKLKNLYIALDNQISGIQTGNQEKCEQAIKKYLES